MMNVSSKKKGFATMDRVKLLEVCRQGGRAAHAKGTAHQFTSETGRLAALRGVARRKASSSSSSSSSL